MSVDTKQLRKAQDDVVHARKFLEESLAKWDVSVVETHMSWLEVRKANTHLRHVESILNNTLDAVLKAETA
jgi:hypothetical protein